MLLEINESYDYVFIEIQKIIKYKKSIFFCVRLLETKLFNKDIYAYDVDYTDTFFSINFKDLKIKTVSKIHKLKINEKEKTFIN
jgi:hypothetical protein